MSLDQSNHLVSGAYSVAVHTRTLILKLQQSVRYRRAVTPCPFATFPSSSALAFLDRMNGQIGVSEVFERYRCKEISKSAHTDEFLPFQCLHPLRSDPLLPLRSYVLHTGLLRMLQFQSNRGRSIDQNVPAHALDRSIARSTDRWAKSIDRQPPTSVPPPALLATRVHGPHPDGIGDTKPWNWFDQTRFWIDRLAPLPKTHTNHKRPPKEESKHTQMHTRHPFLFLLFVVQCLLSFFLVLLSHSRWISCYLEGRACGAWISRFTREISSHEFRLLTCTVKNNTRIIAAHSAQLECDGHRDVRPLPRLERCPHFSMPHPLSHKTPLQGITVQLL